MSAGLLYALLGGLWIIFSDSLVAYLFRDPDLLSAAQTIKGWFYVGVTSLFLYFIIQRHDTAMGRHVRDLEAKQRELAQNENQFRQLADNIHEAFWITDITSGQVVYANPMFDTTWEQPRQALYDDPKVFLDRVHPADRGALEAGLANPLAEGQNKREFRLLWPDGQTRWVCWRSFLMDGRGGPRTLRVDLTEDRTEEKARFSEIGRQRDLIRRYLDMVEVIMVAIGPDGNVRMVNRKGCEILGYDEHEIVGTSWFDRFLPPDIREQIRAKFMEVARGEPLAAGHENMVLTRDGRQRLIRWSNSVILDEDGRFEATLSSGEDITEQRQAMDSQRRLQKAVEQAAEGVLIASTRGFIEYANPAAAKITGHEQDELIGSDWLALLAGHTDGQTLNQIGATLAGGEVWRGLAGVSRRDGVVVEIELTASPVLSQPGLLSNYVVLIRDVTTEQALERKLRQAQKMEAIGTLAGGITHDFNNILGAIIGYTELSLWDLPEGSEVRQHLEQVLLAGERAKNLVRQILAFSRQAEQEKKAISLGPLIKESLKLLRATLPATVDLRHQISPEAGLVMADPVQMQQVLMNLCTNAAHAIGDNPGLIQVVLEPVEVDEADAASKPDLLPGRYVRLATSDTGTGIAPELLDKIFDPYFTTKKPGQGTGLGLSIVHGIVKSHGGAISVYSEPGNGATFNVYLPVVDEGERGDAVGESDIHAGSERILLIDDEQTLVETGRGMLERMGYRVTAFTSAVAALQAFLDNPDSFDVVVTDQNMPQLSGSDLAQRVAAVRPDLPIVLCTGFSEAITQKRAQSMGIAEFVMKPVLGSQLGRAIRSALKKRQTAG